ncbi:MAG: hypothetical protein ACI9XU_002088 [Arenicella sp.]|jgi:hypothetical protein
MIMVLLMQTATVSHGMEHLDRGHTEQCLVYSSGDHAFAVEIDSQPIPDYQFGLSQNSSATSLVSLSRPSAYSCRAPPIR